MRVLVTGATGYIGGRLVPELLSRGHAVRCAARTPEKLDGRVWRDQVEVAEVDVFDRDSLDAACQDVEAVYFLVHSMDGKGGFAERDREAAANVRDAATAAGVQRLVYLGGLGVDDDHLSDHLRSRHEVGRVLADGPVPVTELRAAIIIGSGSASFEMLRHLVEVLPIMTTPKWVSTRCQPIAVRDVLTYLAAVIEEPDAADQILEIGGPDVMTYAELMQAYAGVAGLRRRIILPVPVLTPGLSSLWVGLVTPLPTGLARPLVDSLVNEVVVRDDRITEIVPHETVPFEESVRLALGKIQDLDVQTTWASAGGATARRDPGSAEGAGPEDPQGTDPHWAGGTVMTDERREWSSAPPEALYAAVSSIGGSSGYHSMKLLWEVRGLLDKLIGGIGLRRGRRHPHELAVGEVVDFWRVEAIDAPHLLRLRAEMRVPGEAWLEFRIDAFRGGSRLVQRARFYPRGLWGRLYWTALVPFHQLIFPRMARRLAREAQRFVDEGTTGSPTSASDAGQAGAAEPPTAADEPTDDAASA